MKETQSPDASHITDHLLMLDILFNFKRKKKKNLAFWDMEEASQTNSMRFFS